MIRFVRAHAVHCTLLLATLAGEPTSVGRASDSEPSQPLGASVVLPYQDLLFLGRDRMLVVRVRIEVDGQPFGEPWRASMRNLFAVADRNNDGMLSTEEREKPSETDSPLRGELIAILTMQGFSQADVAPPDGQISLDEFVAFTSVHYGGAFQPPPVSSAAFAREGTSGGNATPGAILFKTLDQDSDGSVSEGELRDGVRSIRSRDFDGDGASSLAELDHIRSPFGQQRNTTSGAAARVPIVALSPERVDKEVLQAVLKSYRQNAGSGIEGIPASALACAAAELPRYDEDGNSLIDRRELRSFLNHPCRHLEFAVRLGQFDGAAPNRLEVLSSEVGEDVVVKISDLGFISVILDDVQLEIGVNSRPKTEKTMSDSFLRQFKGTDSDGNGYIDQKEAEQSPVYSKSFGVFDRDGDGKIFEEEIVAVLKGRIMTALARTRLTATNRGKDLFEILDLNRDGRLAQRELQGAASRFSLWDADADKLLTEDEVPQLYQLVFDRGVPDLPGMTEAVMPQARGQATPTPAGPGWFSRMDRNGDGDVALQEFLGTPEQFQTLDANADGLLDTEEAASLPAASGSRKSEPSPER